MTLRDPRPLIFNVFSLPFLVSFLIASWRVPGFHLALFFASIFNLKILLISYLFLRPILNWFLLIFGKQFQLKLCRVCLTFATWSTFKNLDFAWKVLQKWRFGMPGWIPKSIKNRIQIWMKKTLGKSSKNQPKINQKCTRNSLKKLSKKSVYLWQRFNRKQFKKS